MISGGLSGGSTTISPSPLPNLATPWSELLHIVNILLGQSTFLLEESGINSTEIKKAIEGTRDEVYFLINAIDPDAPGLATSESVLIAFVKSITDYFITMYLWTPIIDFLGSASFDIDDVVNQLAGSIVYPVSFSMARDQCNKYVGFLILHYLYEYTVLFSSGLTSAFEVF